MKTFALWFAAFCAACAIAVLGQRIRTHAAAELAYDGEPRSLAQLARAPGSTGVSARLAEVKLMREELAVFELCTEDRLDRADWLNAFQLAIFERVEQPAKSASLRLLLRVTLDQQHLRLARHNSAGSCLTLGRGVIEHSAMHTVDAVWPEAPPPARIRDLPLRVRILASRELGRFDRGAFAVLALSMISLLVLLNARTAGAPLMAADVAALRMPALLVAASTLAVVVAITQVWSQGSLETLWKGLTLAAVQAGVPWLFARGSRRQNVLPAGHVGGLARTCGLACATALLLWAAAKLALRFVPATGEAPIETFVAAPSGMLCVAALGVVLPLGEELFFRGLLFRALLDWTGHVAVTAGVSWLLFVLLHAQQSWGNWGGLSSIAVAGALLTALRSVSGSVWLPALAHVLYNVSLSAAAVGLI